MVKMDMLIRLGSVAVRQLCALYVFTGFLERRALFRPRLTLCLAGYSLLWCLGAAVWSSNLELYWVAYMLLTGGTMALMVICSKGSLSRYLYTFVGAQILLSGANSFGTISLAVLGKLLPCFAEYPLSVFVTLLFSWLAMLLCYYLFGKSMRLYKSVDFSWDILFPYALGTLILAIFSLMKGHAQEPESPAVYLPYCAEIIFCLLVLYLQHQIMLKQFYSAQRLKEEAERIVVQQLWYESSKQYSQIKENVELISIKSHDLKHLVQLLKRGKIDTSVIEEIEHLTDIYECNIKTGNEVLDVILTDNSLRCQKKDIRLMCVAEGNKLAFMDVVDLYTLFGNALDNAIAYVSTLDREKRFIRLNVKATAQFVLIHLDNYFEGELCTEDGLPVTTHHNTAEHGYGMKSMRRVAEKYDGSMRIRAADNLFALDIMLPIPQ